MKQREKIFVIGGLVLLAGTAAWKLTRGDATGSGDSITGAISRIAEGDRLHRSVDALVKELTVALPTISPAEQESAIHDDLARKAQENQIMILSFKGMESAGRGGAMKSMQMVQYRLELYGQFDSFMKLINSLEKSSIPYLVREMQFESAPRVPGAGPGGQGGGGSQQEMPQLPQLPPPPQPSSQGSSKGSSESTKGSSKGSSESTKHSSSGSPESIKLPSGKSIDVSTIPPEFREQAMKFLRPPKPGSEVSNKPVPPDSLRLPSGDVVKISEIPPQFQKMAVEYLGTPEQQGKQPAAPEPPKKDSAGSGGSTDGMPDTIKTRSGKVINLKDMPPDQRARMLEFMKKKREGSGSSNTSKPGSSDSGAGEHSSVTNESPAMTVVVITESSEASAAGGPGGRRRMMMGGGGGDGGSQGGGAPGGAPDGGGQGGNGRLMPANGKVHVTMRIQSYLFPAEPPAVRGQGTATAEGPRLFGGGAGSAAAAERPAGRAGAEKP